MRPKEQEDYENDLLRRMGNLVTGRNSYINKEGGDFQFYRCPEKVPFCAHDSICPKCKSDQLAHLSSRISALKKEFNELVALRKGPVKKLQTKPSNKK